MTWGGHSWPPPSFRSAKRPAGKPAAGKNARPTTGKNARPKRGFTLLEVLIATAVAGIAIAGLLNGISHSARNANRLVQRDRATELARAKMDELLVNHNLPRGAMIDQPFDPAITGGLTAGWRARVTAFETTPGAAPGSNMWVVDRIELEIWWMDGTNRRTFNLEGFRRSIL